jgi:hypothetical protein
MTEEEKVTIIRMGSADSQEPENEETKGMALLERIHSLQVIIFILLLVNLLISCWSLFR